MPKNPTIEEISRKLGEIETGATNVQRALSDFKVQELPGGTTADQKATSDITGDATRTLTATLGGLDFGEEKKTIMERFAERERLAKEAEAAGRGLVESRFAGEIEEAGEVGRRQITSAREAARSLGPASSGALIKIEEEKVNKKIKGLERQRDELLAQGRFDLASRLDDLMVSEQEALTTARQNYLTNFFNVSRELRERAAFETPEEKRTREFELSREENERKQVIDLATKAPSAGILSTDTLEQAISKFKNSNEYKMDIRGGELAIRQAEENIALTRAQARKLKMETEGFTGIGAVNTAIATGDVEGALQASSGGSTITSEQTKTIAKAKTVLGQLEVLNDLFQRDDRVGIRDIIGKDLYNVTVGRLRKFNPFDTTAKEIDSLLKQTIPNLARGVFGEVGVLTDTDIANYEGTLPNLTNIESARKALMSAVVRTVQRSLEDQLVTLAEAGYDVSGFQASYIDVVDTADRLFQEAIKEGGTRGLTTGAGEGLEVGQDLRDNLFLQLYNR